MDASLKVPPQLLSLFRVGRLAFNLSLVRMSLRLQREHLSGAVHENLSRAIRRTEIYELVHFESSLRRESLLMEPLLRCEM